MFLGRDEKMEKTSSFYKPSLFIRSSAENLQGCRVYGEEEEEKELLALPMKKNNGTAAAAAATGGFVVKVAMFPKDRSKISTFS